MSGVGATGETASGTVAPVPSAGAAAAGPVGQVSTPQVLHGTQQYTTVLASLQAQHLSFDVRGCHILGCWAPAGCTSTTR